MPWWRWHHGLDTTHLDKNRLARDINQNSYISYASKSKESIIIESRFIIGIIQTVAGWVFIVLGILGLFLPILQGILFLVIGLMLLSTRYEFAQNILHKAEQRYPDEYARMHGMKERLLTSKPLIAAGVIVLVGLCVLGVYLAVSTIWQLTAGS